MTFVRAALLLSTAVCAAQAQGPIIRPGAAPGLRPGLTGSSGARACTPSTLNGFICQTTVQTDPLVTIHYTLLADKTAVNFAVEAETQGYAALGVGPGMVGAQIVLGFTENNGADTLITTIPQARSVDGVVNGIVDPAVYVLEGSLAVTEANGVTTTSFTYLVAEGGVITDLSAAPIVWAERQQDAAGLHDTRGVVILNLEEALDVDATLLTASSLRACQPSLLPGLVCAVQVSETPLVTIHYALAEDRQTVALAVEAATQGYAALGAGTGMVGAEIVLGFEAAGADTLIATIPQARSLDGVLAGVQTPNVDGAPYVVPGTASVTEANGITTTFFTYDINGGSMITDTTAASFVWAQTNQDEAAQHGNGAGDRGIVTINLEESAPLPCTESTLPGFACTVEVQATPFVALHYALSNDQSLVNLAVEADTEGYAAIGVGPEMVGAQILLGFTDAANGDTLIATVPTARNGDGVAAGVVDLDAAAYILAGSASVVTQNGMTVTSYTYPVAAGGQINDLTNVPLVWGESDQDAAVQHRTRGGVTVNVQDAAVGAAAAAVGNNDEEDDWVRIGLLVGGGSLLVIAGLIISVLAAPAAAAAAAPAKRSSRRSSSRRSSSRRSSSRSSSRSPSPSQKASPVKTKPEMMMV